jgi:diguanylate cyclase (GGDEF)-like protein/PAS domain S-box-containing protein
MNAIPHVPPANFTDLLLDAVCVVDRNGFFLFVSAASEQIFGYPPDEMIGKPMIEFVYPGDREKTLNAVSEILGGEKKPYFENRYVRKDGRVAHIMWSARWSEEEQVRVAVARDITERKHAESMQSAVYAISEAANSPGDLNNLFHCIHDVVDELLQATNFMVGLYDEKKKELTFPYSAHLYSNQQPPCRLPYIIATQAIESEATLLLTPQSLLNGSAAKALNNWLVAPIKTANQVIGVLMVMSADQSTRFTEKDKELLQFVSIQVAAAIERKRMFARLEFMAQYDPLTQLPNRALFIDRLQTALINAQREDKILAVFYLDLNKFKQVNDTYGHATGDQLLYEVSCRLAGCVRESDTVGRIGGDEFVILAGHIKHRNDVAIIKNKINTSLSQPYYLAKAQLNIFPSVGVAIYPDHGVNESELIHYADVAMYQDKKEQGN